MGFFFFFVFFCHHNTSRSSGIVAWPATHGLPFRIAEPRGQGGEQRRGGGQRRTQGRSGRREGDAGSSARQAAAHREQSRIYSVASRRALTPPAHTPPALLWFPPLPFLFLFPFFSSLCCITPFRPSIFTLASPSSVLAVYTRRRWESQMRFAANRAC